MAECPLPPPLKMQGDQCKNWKLWLQMWQAHAILTDLATKPPTYQVAKFIACIGPDALEVHNSLPFVEENDKSDLQKILDLWEAHCVPSTNVIFERYTFHHRTQMPGEPFDSFLTALRQAAATCEYGNLQDEFIRDKIVCGIQDDNLCKRLLQESKLDLTRCIAMCKAAEVSQQQLTQFKAETVHQNERATNPEALQVLWWYASVWQSVLPCCKQEMQKNVEK